MNVSPDMSAKPTPDRPIGLWPGLYEGSQFPAGEAALNQFFRQMAPDTGSYDEQRIAAAPGCAAAIASAKPLPQQWTER